MTTPPSNGQWPQGQPYDPRQGEQGGGVNYNPDNYADHPDEQGQYAQEGQGQYGGYEQPGAHYDQYAQPPEQYPQGDPHAQQYDPYAQQYDAYTQAHDTYHPQQQPWPSQQLSAEHPPQAQPGGGWGQQPPKSKAPLIAGIAIAVAGAIVAVVILIVNSGDDDSSAGASTTSQSQTSEKTEKTTEGSSTAAGGGYGQTDIPSDVPVPSSAEISSAYGDGSGGVSALFETDDPKAAYDDWTSEFEDAGYDISSSGITGSGEDVTWYLTAEDDTYKVEVAFAYGTGAITVKKK